MSEQFLSWLQSELSKKGWDKKELSERTNLSSSAIYSTMRGDNSVSFEFCREIAFALGESPTRLARMAGLLPRVPDAKQSDTVQEIVDLLGDMDEVNRQDALSYVKMRFSKPIPAE